MYEILPSYEKPFVRFAVHTGMRLREITTLTWGAVDLERRVVHVAERFAKNGKAREVALGEVAFSILSALRPETPAESDHVFIGRRGEPILTFAVASMRRCWRCGNRPSLARGSRGSTIS